MISELDGWPTCTPVNASPAMLPPPAHDSGPGWVAGPFLYGSFIRYSMPVVGIDLWRATALGFGGSSRKFPASPHSDSHDPRFHRPPCDPGRSDFPSPVLTLAFPSAAYPPPRTLKRWLTYTPLARGLRADLVPSLMVRLAPALSPGTPKDRQVPRAPSHAPGVTPRVAPSNGASAGVTPPYQLLRTHASDQNPPVPFRHQPYRAGLCRLLPAPAGSWPFPTLSPRVLPRMLGPIPRRAVEVHLPVSSFHNNGLPCGITGRRTRNVPLSDFRAGKFTQLQSFQ